MKKHVLIAMATWDGFPWIATTKSLISMIPELLNAGIVFSFVDLTGNPMVGMARSLLLGSFMENEQATHILFVDDDVAWPVGAVSRIVSHDVDVVGGVYPRRFDPPGYVVRPLDQIEVTKDGLAEVEGLAGGFLCITKECIEQMIEAYPECEFKAERYASKKGYELFSIGRKGDEFWGEDYEFCRKWRAIGGKCWADTAIPFIHAGFKEYQADGSWYTHLTKDRK